MAPDDHLPSPPPAPAQPTSIAPTDLSSIAGKLDILIAKHEVMERRQQTDEDRHLEKLAELDARARDLRSTALSLADAGTSLQRSANDLRGVAERLTSARAIWRAITASVPTASRLLVLGAGATVGAFLATWLFLAVHGPQLIGRVVAALP